MTQFAQMPTRIFRQTLAGRRAPSILAHAMMAPLRWARRAWIEYYDQRVLQALSDHQLRDIGLSRAQIPRAGQRWEL